MLFLFYLKVDTNASEWTIEDWAVLPTSLTGKTTTGVFFCNFLLRSVFLMLKFSRFSEMHFSLQRWFSQTSSISKYI